jgi:small subunit ribosomal protein S2
MESFIFGERNKIHIINLEKTLPLFEEASKFLKNLAANKGRILFVGTKRQAREIVKEEAERAGCPYVNHRWLGGMLTNFKTVKQSIKRLNEYETMIADGSLDKLKKREALTVRRDHEKLVRSIGGIKEMTSLPDAIFVIDVGFESGAVEEATKLGIPVVGIVDSNNSIENISYVIPGNDDSSRAIRLYSRGMADAVLAGKNQAITELAKSVSEETTEEE